MALYVRWLDGEKKKAEVFVKGTQKEKSEWISLMVDLTGKKFEKVIQNVKYYVELPGDTEEKTDDIAELLEEVIVKWLGSEDKYARALLKNGTLLP